MRFIYCPSNFPGSNTPPPTLEDHLLSLRRQQSNTTNKVGIGLFDSGIFKGWVAESDKRRYKLTKFERLALKSSESRETSNFDDEDYESSSSSLHDSPAPTEEEVRKLAHKLATSIFSDWSQLKGVVENYGDKLRKRWEGKTKGDKAKILLEVWPNMSFSHRLGFHAVNNEDCGQKVQEKDQYRDAYIWPQINLEDLTCGKTLLLYIDSRGRHPPQTFVHADWTACFLGRRSDSITPSLVLKSYTMFLDGRTPIRYGRIVAWDKDAEAQNQLLIGNGFVTIKGLLILEIQQRIMNFLVQCSLALLSDLTTSFFSPVSTSSHDTINKTMLNVIATEALYRAPMGSNFKRLRTVISTRRMLAEDHLIALRMHPGYFNDALLEKTEHRYEKLLDESGARHPNIDSLAYWNGVILEAILQAYGVLWTWDHILQQITNVVSLNEKYHTEISPKKRLPEEYRYALLVLRETLVGMEWQTSQELQHVLPRSPAYQHMFSRSSLDPANQIVVAHEEVKTDVIMGFFEIITDFSKFRLFNPLDLTDELERAITAEPKHRSMLSPLVVRLVADMGSSAGPFMGSIFTNLGRKPDSEHKEDAQDIEETIKVDTQDLKVFKKLFYTGSATGVADTSWKELVHAMTVMGFEAVKLHGSLWQFDPIVPSIKDSIQFHQPLDKIPLRDMIIFGWRLNRAYGWVREMFSSKSA